MVKGLVSQFEQEGCLTQVWVLQLRQHTRDVGVDALAQHLVFPLVGRNGVGHMLNRIASHICHLQCEFLKCVGIAPLDDDAVLAFAQQLLLEARRSKRWEVIQRGVCSRDSGHKNWLNRTIGCDAVKPTSLTRRGEDTMSR